jgi:hypothetical protein
VPHVTLHFGSLVVVVVGLALAAFEMLHDGVAHTA